MGDGFDDEAQPPLPVLEATEIRKSQSDGYKLSFGFTNESDEDLSDTRVGAACYDAAGKVVGGDSTYPDSAPYGRAIRIDLDASGVLLGNGWRVWPSQTAAKDQAPT